MKKLLTILCFFSLSVNAQLVTTVFTQRAIATTDDVRPGAGLIDFFGHAQKVNYPNPALTGQRGTSYYFRITWNSIRANNFAEFDGYFNQAIDRGQSVIFRIVCIDDSYSNTVGGARLAYPTAVHTAMQGETNPDFIIPATVPVWWPNYNSTSFKAAHRQLQVDVKAHLMNTFRNGVRYYDAIYGKDIDNVYIYGEMQGFVGNLGNTWTYPTGTTPTFASLQEIVQSQIDNFPDIPLIGNINATNSNSNLPVNFGSWMLTVTNGWGQLGLRSDHMCDEGTFNYDYTNKTTVENGINFKTEIGNRWRVAPFFFEPQQFKFAKAGQCDYWHILTEDQTFHGINIENADNIENGGAIPTCTADLFRKAAIDNGYRYTLQTMQSGDSVRPNMKYPVNINWANIGNTPIYERCNVRLLLKKAGVWVDSTTLTFDPFMVQPGTWTTTADWTMKNALTGAYDLYLVIRFKKFRQQTVPVQITGGQADGTWLLRSGIPVGTTAGGGPVTPPPPPPNIPPVVNAGSDQTDSLPKNVDTLIANVSDANEDAVTVQWTQLSGPNTATMSAPTNVFNPISGLIEGTYNFRITANDGHGGITSDDVAVKVFNVTPPVDPPDPPPVYNAPTIAVNPLDSTIQLPASTANLRVQIVSSDTTIASYQWLKVLGADGPVITTPTSATTTITGLVAGPYRYKITVTDNAGNSVFSFVTLYVNPVDIPPPVPLPGPPDNSKSSPIIKKAF